MYIIALYNMKGGVGKTASAVNLAYLAAGDGFRTLLCDLDPQGSASFYLQVKSPKKLSAKHLAKGDSRFLSSIKSTNYDNLDIIPADFSYRKLAVILAEKKRSKKRIREALEGVKNEYDLVFIDAPAGLDLEAEAVFTAADMVLIPIIPTVLSVETLKLINRFFVKNEMDLGKIKIFFSLVDKRKKMHTEMMSDLREKESNFLYSSIPYSSVVEKMGTTKDPVPVHSKKSAAVLAYKDLWTEIKGGIQFIS